jgi:hypothetical protein
VRFSHLLREPLIVSGELGYLGPRSLDRRVTTPYRETTAIRGDSVQIDREGERARSFALKHAPELQGFLDAFTALLAGDSAALKQTFEVVAFGEENDWALRLTPLEQGTRRRLRAIAIRGSGAEPQCFATLNAEDGGSVMLLGNRTAPTISAATSLDELLARCGTR